MCRPIILCAFSSDAIETQPDVDVPSYVYVYVYRKLTTE